MNKLKFETKLQIFGIIIFWMVMAEVLHKNIFPMMSDLGVFMVSSVWLLGSFLMFYLFYILVKDAILSVKKKMDEDKEK